MVSLASVHGQFPPGAAAAPDSALRVLLLALRHEAEPVEEGVGGGHVLAVGGTALTLRQTSQSSLAQTDSVCPPYLLLTDKPPDEAGKPSEELLLVLLRPDQNTPDHARMSHTTTQT